MSLYEPVPGLKITLKSPDELAMMRQAGRIVALAHQAMREAVKPGVSTAELDRIAATVIRDHGATPAFLGQKKPNSPDYPNTITASINHQVIHGIPSETELLKDGDIVSLDTGCFFKGYVGDSAWTYAVGEVSRPVQRLLDVTEAALMLGISRAKVGTELRDLSRTVQTHVESNGLGVIRDYTGHGVGRAMWEEPQIPNWWPGKSNGRVRFDNMKLVSGMTFAIEPMVSIGRPDVIELDDHWTVITKDRSLCAHFEHTIAVTVDGPIIMTTL
jgi:methionyl aminopeptidase